MSKTKKSKHSAVAGQRSDAPAEAAHKPVALKQTIMTPDGQMVQITTRPAPTPAGVPNKAVGIKTKRRHEQAVQTLLQTDDVVRDQVGGFVTFLREHAIVGLAVGFVIGTQAQTVVKQLVTSFIDPSIQLFFGGAKLSERKFMLHLFANHAEFGWGAMVYSVINLLFVLASVYILIKLLKLDKLDTPKPK